MIDSHTHLDLIHQYHPDRISWLRAQECNVISWAFGNNIRTQRDLKTYLRQQAATIEALYGQGLGCWHLAGIHPRNIPLDIDTLEVPKLLVPFIEHPLCLGLGEIGLETGSDRECDILRRQLGLCDAIRSMGKKIGVHTPRNRKAPITQITLDILSEFPGIQDITVIDHTTTETLPWVLEAGYHAGITVSPPKTSVAELIRMLSDHSREIDRIMVNSDSGSEFFEDVVNLYQNPTIEKTVRERILNETAIAFFNPQY